MNVLALPSSIVGFATSSSIIVTMVVLAYIVWTMGYPRPMWTHYTIDPTTYCVTTMERVFVAIESIKEAFEAADERCSTTRRIAAAFGSQLSKLVELYDRCQSTLSRVETVNVCVDIILGSTATPSPCAIELTNQLNRIGTQNVYMGGMVTSDGSVHGKRMACAVADVRLIAMHVIPYIRQVHAIQTKDMSEFEIFKHHVISEFVDYQRRVSTAFTNAKAKQTAVQ
jgi:hypothetical protein